MFLVYCCTPSTFFYDYCFHVVLLPVLFWQSFVAFALYLVSTKSLDFVNYVPIYHHYCCYCWKCIFHLLCFVNESFFWVFLLHPITTHFQSLVILSMCWALTKLNLHHLLQFIIKWKKKKQFTNTLGCCINNWW